jgi:hypothetical protein
MMTLEEIRAALADRRPTRVAKALGCRVATIIDLRAGRTKNPGYLLVKGLSDYLQRPVL